MRINTPITCVVVGIFCVLLGATLPAYSATTGNIKGKVTDVSTGESLPGVNILVVGSGRGGVTNDKGEYLIVGVTPGVYTLRASILGYQPLEVEKVAVDADKTVVYDFKLAGTDIEIEGVTVIGEPPLVDVTKTAGDQTFNRDKIEQLPNVKGVADVLTLQAGVVKFGDQLFVRGGRANQTQILVDGVPVNDVSGVSGAAGTSTANEQLAQLYAGTASSGLGVSANAIQSVTISSGGLDAEYGNAQSGVVNILTKGGSDTYNGSVQYRTDAVSPYDFNSRYYSGDISGPEPITSSLLPALGVEVPGKVRFFIGSSFDQSDGPYPFNTSQFYTPVRRRVKLGGIFGDILENVGFTYSDKQRNALSFNAKLNYLAGETDQFSYSYRAIASSDHTLRSVYSSYYLHDSSASVARLETQDAILWTHFFGTNSALNAHISRQVVDRTSSVGGLSPDRYSLDLTTRDPNEDGFADLGTSQGWSTSNLVIWNLKVKYDAQIHELHYLKTGIDLYYEHYQSTAISWPLSTSRDTTQRGQYPGFGFARWVSNNTPSRGAMWVQDNIAFTGLNINIGLRYDWFYLGKQVFDPEFVERWRFAVADRIPAVWLEHESFASQLFHGNFSPRLAIGYPISTRTVFYFNYGHFLQYPERDDYYRDPITRVVSGNYVGNPGLKPERTISYEAGFDQLVFEDLKFGIRGFYKDIFDNISVQKIVTDTRVNLDYGSVRGFEVILNKSLTNNYSGSLGYTFQLAKGRASDKNASIISPQLAGLPREVRLDYDQQHTVNLFVAYRVGVNEDYDVFGLPLNNWGASLTWNFGSGFPYTPYNQERTLADQYLKNTGNGPFTSELNISMFKGFVVFEKLNLVVTLDVTNLLNRRNVDLNALGFNRVTGRPLRFGDYNPDDSKIYPWGATYNEGSFASSISPYIFRSPRQITLGMKITWD